jgi:hypothetical protein
MVINPRSWSNTTLNLLLLPNDLPVLRKFFPLDKNYLLEEAQLVLQDKLLFFLFDQVKEAYELQRNPLRLRDAFSLKIQNYKLLNLQPLEVFYQNVAGVYRYKWGDSQLEFVWDGRDHSEKYREEWADFFKQSIQRFCQQELFVQAVLDVTVFLPSRQDEKLLTLAENRMNTFMLQHFEVKIHKSKGLIHLKTA